MAASQMTPVAPTSALQQFDLVLNAFPLFGIRRSSLFLADDRPFFRKFGVELLEVLLAGGYLFLGIDGFDRTLGLAQRAVDALIRVDDQEIRTLVEAVDGTDLHTVHVFAFDAAFGDHERHDLPFPSLFRLVGNPILPHPQNAQAAPTAASVTRI